MRGLDPRIHSSARAIGAMDRRVKPGDDSFLGFSSLCLSASVVHVSIEPASVRFSSRGHRVATATFSAPAIFASR